MIRVLLAEDQAMIREALAALLSFEEEFVVVAQVGRGDEVLKAADDTHPDVAVLAWCLREAVTNVIRHSGAKTCRIRLTQQPGELSLEVSDDGHGPGSQDADAPHGAGLRGMSERLSTAGGRLSLGAADPGLGNRPGNRQNQGFKLTATVPVDHYDA